MRRWQWLTLIAVCIGGVVWFFVAQKATKSVSPSQTLTPSVSKLTEPGITLEGVEGLVLRREGRKVWELFMDSITLDKPQTKAMAQGIRQATYYDTDGKPILWLSAQSLVYDANTGDVTLTGNLKVKARMPKGRELTGEAEQVVWHERERKLEVLGAIGQTRDIRFIVQHGLYHLDRTVLECRGGVIFLTKTVHLTCPSLRANLNTRYYIAQPPVRLTAMLDGASSLEPFQPVVYHPQSTQPPKPETPKPEAKKPEQPKKEKEPKEPKKEEQKEKKKRHLHFKTDKPVIGKEGQLFIEDAIITEEGEEYTVTAKKAVYNEDTEQVRIDGGVRFEDPETIATAPKAQVDMKQRIATFLGPVEVIVKPKKETKEAPTEKEVEKKPNGQKQLPSKPDTEKGKEGEKDKPQTEKPNNQAKPEAEKPNGQKQQPKATEQKEEKKRERYRERVRERGGKMTCQRVEYYYRERRIVAIGNVQFEQEGRYKGSAEKAIYLTRDEILTLEGKVFIHDLRKGHRFECPKFVTNLKTDDIEITPPISGVIVVEEEEEEKPTEKKEGNRSGPLSAPNELTLMSQQERR